MRRVHLLLLAALVALVVTSSATPMAPPRLVGTVGPGFTISLKQNGKLVRTLKPGRYTFVVSDKSPIHDFEVQGPGATRGPNRAITTVAFTGTKTVTVTLAPGKYRYYCRPHASQMFGLFTVA